MHSGQGVVRNKKRTDLTSSYPLVQAAIEIWFPSLIIAHPCDRRENYYQHQSLIVVFFVDLVQLSATPFGD